MSYPKEQNQPRNAARRHFLGVSAATGARLAGLAALATAIS
ncbi:hypothetical protein EV281_1111, partial [Rhizobium sp. BK418]